jgi:hypothetical protein
MIVGVLIVDILSSFYSAVAVMFSPLGCEGIQLDACALMIFEKFKGNSV